MAKPLTPVAIRNVKPGAKRLEIADPGCQGLYLVVQTGGAKSWAFRYRFAGKPKKLTIGPVYIGSGKGDEPDTAELDQPNTLAGARELAIAAARQVAKGTDPASHKRREKAAARQRAENAELLDRDTVEAVARLFIQKYAKAHTKSWDQTARLIGLKPDPKDETKLVRSKSGGEVLSKWGNRPVREITRRDVHDLLDGIVSRGAPVTANRVLAHMRKMFNWAASRDIIDVSPCIGVTPPTAETSRDRILSDEELRLVWLGAQAIGWPFGHMVQQLILTLQRRDEVAGMFRKELKPQDRLWIIPKDRAKNGLEHEVPMSAAAWDALEELPKIGKVGLVFTVTGETPVSGFSRAKERLDEEIAKIQRAEAVERGENPKEVKPPPHWTLHDLRRTGASGMARLGIQLPVIEKVLNHISGSFRGVVGVYQRHSFSEEKRKALEAWASHIDSVVSGKRADNVISMHAREKA
jgi:integrase